MRNIPIQLAIMFVLSSAAADAQCDTVTIGASKDNTIFHNTANNSAGGSAGIFAGTTAFGSPRRGLIAFDVAGIVPAGATITAVELRLYLGMAAGGVSQSVGLHRLTKDWGEGTAGSTLPTVRMAGNGFASSPGDATWNANFRDTSLWSSPGAAGDFFVIASASSLVDNTVDTPFFWSSTPALVSDIQSWLDNPATNFGWALVSANETSIATARAFYSREATVDAGGDPMDLARRPLLTITYVPEPASAVLLLIAASMALLVRRKPALE
ncbi:MAG: DNRLRE domain-containing protein [Planctomycetes bacterium]|nr:DNRLRE domain-containing protein [Planctomycetota bacterium]